MKQVTTPQQERQLVAGASNGRAPIIAGEGDNMVAEARRLQFEAVVSPFACKKLLVKRPTTFWPNKSVQPSRSLQSSMFLALSC